MLTAHRKAPPTTTGQQGKTDPVLDACAESAADLAAGRTVDGDEFLRRFREKAKAAAARCGR